MEDFHSYLNTGVASSILESANNVQNKQEIQSSIINNSRNPSNSVSNNFSIRKATMIKFIMYKTHIQKHEIFFHIKVQCDQNTQNILKKTPYLTS